MKREKYIVKGRLGLFREFAPGETIELTKEEAQKFSHLLDAPGNSMKEKPNKAYKNNKGVVKS